MQSYGNTKFLLLCEPRTCVSSLLLRVANSIVNQHILFSISAFPSDAYVHFSPFCFKLNKTRKWIVLDASHFICFTRS